MSTKKKRSSTCISLQVCPEQSFLQTLQPAELDEQPAELDDEQPAELDEQPVAHSSTQWYTVVHSAAD